MKESNKIVSINLKLKGCNRSQVHRTDVTVGDWQEMSLANRIEIINNIKINQTIATPTVEGGCDFIL